MVVELAPKSFIGMEFFFAHRTKNVAQIFTFLSRTVTRLGWLESEKKLWESSQDQLQYLASTNKDILSSAPPGNGGYQLISHCVSMYLKIHQIVNIFRWHPGRKNIPLLQVYLVKRSVVKGTRKVCYISFGVFSINIKLSAVDSSSILQWYSNEGIQDIAMHNGAPEERHGKCLSSCEAQRFLPLVDDHKGTNPIQHDWNQCKFQSPYQTCTLYELNTKAWLHITITGFFGCIFASIRIYFDWT